MAIVKIYNWVIEDCIKDIISKHLINFDEKYNKGKEGVIVGKKLEEMELKISELAEIICEIITLCNDAGKRPAGSPINERNN